MGWRTLLERRQPEITDSDSRAADCFRNAGRFAVHLLLRQQMPPLMTLSGIALLVIGVVIAVRAKPEKPLTESVSES